MKKLIMGFCSLMLVLLATGVVFADKGSNGKFAAKAGDEIYVCGCGESCKCGTLAHKEGNCGCGQKLVKAAVAKTEKGKVFYKIDGKEFSAPQKGKFVCGCGEGCDCGFVSQNAGNCGCDKPMVKIKK